MPTLREIRRRIRSVKSTGQITRAMEMVAATKMRRAQAMALASRPYSDKIGEVLAELAARTASAGEIAHPLLERRPAKRLGVLLMTTDRGLCGALNSNVMVATTHLLAERGLPADIVTVGRKGRDWVLRHRLNLLAEFTNLGDHPSHDGVIPVARVVITIFLNRQVDQVFVVYPRFVNTLVQRPTTYELLPVEPHLEGGKFKVDYIYEPDPATVMAQLLPRYIEVQIYQMLLETVASEHSARMVAMRNATENAGELAEHLTLVHNKKRQEVITKELLEIAAGSTALAG